MKSIKLLLIGLLVVFALAGCSKSSGGSPDPGPGTDGSVVGQWHMISWSVLTQNDDIDIYVSYTQAGSFDLYQRLYTPGYVHFKGTYSYRDKTLSGVYSDNVPWGDSYKVTFNADATQMTLTSTTSTSDVAVYAKTTIPSEIISGDLGAKASESRADEQVQRFL